MAGGIDPAGGLLAQQLMARQSVEPEVPKTPSGEDPEAIRDAARQFESVFLHQVFKTMRATVPEGGLLDTGFGGQVFTDMLDQEYATLASQNGQVGLAAIIAEQLGAPAGEGLRSAPSRGMRVRAAQSHALQGHALHSHALHSYAAQSGADDPSRSEMPSEDAPADPPAVDRIAE